MLLLISYNLGDEWHTPQKAYVRTLCDDASLFFKTIQKQTKILKLQQSGLLKLFN